jgi:peptide deformylase
VLKKIFMAKLKVRIYGDPCLKKRSQKIDQVGPGERFLIESMIETMYAHKGVGLAAPQVGINQQLFVVDVGDGPFAVINPEILRQSGSSRQEEGCLSIPGVTIEVKRPARLKVRYVDAHNHPVEREMSDLLARVFQHENDHLQGKLIVDYADAKEKVKLKSLLEELARRND